MGSEQGLVTLIRGLMEARGWRQKDLAIAAGLSESQISDVMTGKRDTPRPPFLRAVAKALDVEPGILFLAAGYPAETPHTPEEEMRRLAEIKRAAPWVASLLDQLPDMPKEDQLDLVRYAEFLMQRRGRALS